MDAPTDLRKGPLSQRGIGPLGRPPGEGDTAPAVQPRGQESGGLGGHRMLRRRARLRRLWFQGVRSTTSVSSLRRSDVSEVTTTRAPRDRAQITTAASATSLVPAFPHSTPAACHDFLVSRSTSTNARVEKADQQHLTSTAPPGPREDRCGCHEHALRSLRLNDQPAHGGRAALDRDQGAGVEDNRRRVTRHVRDAPSHAPIHGPSRSSAHRTASMSVSSRSTLSSRNRSTRTSAT